VRQRVAVRFEFGSLSCHHPLNLVGNESYEREYPSPIITEQWKEEKIYHNSNNYVYCVTSDNGEAKFAYWGIKPGTDTIVVSASVDGHELEETATITWQGYPPLCSQGKHPCLSNTLSTSPFFTR